MTAFDLDVSGVYGSTTTRSTRGVRSQSNTAAAAAAASLAIARNRAEDANIPTEGGTSTGRMDGTLGFRERFCRSGRLGSEAKEPWNTTTRISIATGGRVPERPFHQASCSWTDLAGLGLPFCTFSNQENEHGFSQLWSPKDGECCRSSSVSAFPEACHVCWGAGEKFLNAKASLTPLLSHCLWKHFF